MWHLPYGRTSNNNNLLLVLSENTGTCSSKHALLKALADELNLDIELVVGIYAMHESNTSGIGKTLADSGYEFIPEAHCYLRYRTVRVDLTRFSVTSAQPITTFFVEKNISPDEIGEFKIKFHQEFIVKMFGTQEAQVIWKIREHCISAMSA